MKLSLTVAVGLLAVPLTAQGVDLSIKTSTDKPLRYKITSSSEIENQREMLINGEERGGGFGGGGGVTATEMTIEFDEGTVDDQTWRAYHKAEALVERPGRDGEVTEQTVKGGLIGKKLFLAEDDGGIVVREGDASGEQVSERLTRGLPVAMKLDGLTPKEAVEVGSEFDLSATFPAALKSLMHPINPAPAEGRGQGRGQGQRGGRGGEGAEGAEGAEEGQRGRRGGRGQAGGRGQGGQGRGGRGGFGQRAVQDAALQAVANDKLTCKATGKLVNVEEKDGMKLATVAFNATMSGKGTPTELGMNAFGRGGRGGAGGRGGRGGRGGGFGGGEDTGKAEANVTVNGTMVIDVATHSLRELKIEGKMKTSSHTERVFERNGEEMDIESTSSADGTFKVAVSCQPAPTGTEKK